MSNVESHFLLKTEDIAKTFKFICYLYALVSKHDT